MIRKAMATSSQVSEDYSRLEILGKPASAVDPGECTLDDPAFWKLDKPLICLSVRLTSVIDVIRRAKLALTQTR
jgi:hypothetical protein